MVQDVAKVTVECEYEVICGLSNGVMTFSDP